MLTVPLTALAAFRSKQKNCGRFGSGLGFRVLRFRGLGFRGLGFRGLGFKGLGAHGQATLGAREIIQYLLTSPNSLLSWLLLR